jgi:hypothetical protein
MFYVRLNLLLPLLLLLPEKLGRRGLLCLVVRRLVHVLLVHDHVLEGERR